MCDDAFTVALSVALVLLIAFAPHCAGACIAPIQPSTLFVSLVGTKEVEPAGIVTVAETGTEIVPPPPLAHVTGRFTLPVSCTVTGAAFAVVSLTCQPPFTHAPEENESVPSVELVMVSGVPGGAALIVNVRETSAAAL